MNYIDENFLLENETAINLYHNYAKKLPIIDYHNHLVAKEIHEDYKYKNISEVWLKHDHYKWRIMRACGYPEDLITSTDDSYEKFEAFASSISRAIGNPVQHFSQLELKRFFDIDLVLNQNNSKKIFTKANKKLETLTVREMIKNQNVEVICTTDDPLDDLAYHFKDQLKVIPTFRPDQVLKLNKEWIHQLSVLTGVEIKSYKNLIDAIEQRLIYFKESGCLLSDHSLERFTFCEDTSEELFSKLYSETCTTKVEDHLRTKILIDLGKLYHKHNIVMQLHIGALRNNSVRKLKQVGRDSGFDSIDDYPVAKLLSGLLSKLDESDQLPKTIIYNINPSDNEIVATMAANFSGQGVMSKVQFGPAWWFNDNKKAIEKQLTDFANHGVLGNFIGMLTDSRSYLSFARHEYFRRILCNLIGSWAESHQIDSDIHYLSEIVENICYYNVKNFLEIGD